MPQILNYQMSDPGGKIRRQLVLPMMLICLSLAMLLFCYVLAFIELLPHEPLLPWHAVRLIVLLSALPGVLAFGLGLACWRRSHSELPPSTQLLNRIQSQCLGAMTLALLTVIPAALTIVLWLFGLS